VAKKSTKAADRRAVVEQMRKQQKSAERRRGFAILGVCLVIAAVIIGLAVYPVIKRSLDLREFNGLALSEIGAPASACQDIITEPADGNANHVDTGTPVTYTDSPPAFGPHWNEVGVAPAPFERKFYTANDRPELESLVHNLEHGYTILWYDETIANDSEQLNIVEGIADQFPSDENNFRFKFKAVPWTSEDGEPFPDGQHVAINHWSAGGSGETDPSTQLGVWQYCSEPSGAALEAFMTEYPYTDSPEPDAG
jgi:hypothetical protein